MVSSAVTKGSVQLTHDGQPVLLMADAQTTGGYPRIAQVAAADLPVCAQYRPGDRMRFKPVSFAEARKAWMDREKELELIGKNLDLLFNT
jgi:antagonist of KipI